MFTLLSEVHFWSFNDVIGIRDTDFGAFRQSQSLKYKLAICNLTYNLLGYVGPTVRDLVCESNSGLKRSTFSETFFETQDQALRQANLQRFEEKC